MILRTYIRVFVASVEESLGFYEQVTRSEPDLRFQFGDVELAAVGDFLLIGSPETAVAPLRGAIGPIVVDDLSDTLSALLGAGAALVQEPDRSATGVFAYLRHPDGTTAEYVQWDDEISHRILGPSASGLGQ